MSETDSTQNKDHQEQESPEPSTQTAPGPNVASPADAQRVADQDDDAGDQDS